MIKVDAQNEGFFQKRHQKNVACSKNQKFDQKK